MNSRSAIQVLIVGNGFAGSLLAWSLIQKGAAVTLMDDLPLFSSSKVAAGIILPVTGRRLAKTNLVDQILPYAKQTYRDIETATGMNIFFEKDTLQVFSSVSNMNEWYARSGDDEMKDYCGAILSKQEVHPSIQNEFGAIILQQSGYVDTLQLLSGIQYYAGQKGTFVNEHFEFEMLEIGKETIAYRDQQYDYIVFCEGYHALKNPYFRYLPFKPAKGEILDFTSRDLNDAYIINTGTYILPLGNGWFRTGATYVWDDLSELTTESGYRNLSDNLAKSVHVNFLITGHQAGVRPSMRDRRPVVGFHPVFNSMGILNGLGTKGALLAPYYAMQMAELITEGKPADREVDVRRFDSLWQET